MAEKQKREVVPFINGGRLIFVPVFEPEELVVLCTKEDTHDEVV